MDTQYLAKTLVAVGLMLVVAGALVYVGGKVGFFGFGKLPGDIRIERENVRIYFPLMSSIIISIVLTAILFLLSRLR